MYVEQTWQLEVARADTTQRTSVARLVDTLQLPMQMLWVNAFHVVAQVRERVGEVGRKTPHADNSNVAEKEVKLCAAAESQSGLFNSKRWLLLGADRILSSCSAAQHQAILVTAVGEVLQALDTENGQLISRILI